MEKDFNFNSIGKKMPYRIPENFLQELESSVMREIQSDDGKAEKETRHTFPHVHSLFRHLVAAAAVAALFTVCYNTMLQRHQNSYADVDRAFDNLSYDDQNFMIDTYSNDAFAYIDDNGNY